eukprot:SM000107S14029  [mRNA]  locus=s107:41415:45012:- [translate_table: standard]
MSHAAACEDLALLRPPLAGPLPALGSRRACWSRRERRCFQRPGGGGGGETHARLLSRLRRYDAFHHNCLAAAELPLAELVRARQPPPCAYLLWRRRPGESLASQILSLVSAFAYALVSERVLLLAGAGDDDGGATAGGEGAASLADLFCEPFHRSSWRLPPSFPLAELASGATAVQDYLSSSIAQQHPQAAPFAIAGAILADDKSWAALFCDNATHDAGRLLAAPPFLLLESDQYFLPSIAAILPDGRRRAEFASLLLAPGAAPFRDLSHFLLHPANAIWDRVSRYRREHAPGGALTATLGVLLPHGSSIALREDIGQAILQCGQARGILPAMSAASATNVSIKVLVTGSEEVAEVLAVALGGDKNSTLAVLHPATDGSQALLPLGAGGSIVSIDERDVFELWLLDDLISASPMSAAATVVHGLAGAAPYLLTKREGLAVAPCRQALSEEPCFQQAPADGACIARAFALHDKLSKTSNFLKVCDDGSPRLQLVPSAFLEAMDEDKGEESGKVKLQWAATDAVEAGVAAATEATASTKSSGSNKGGGISGSRLRLAGELKRFRERMACFSRNGRWARNDAPRPLFWGWLGWTADQCDRRHAELRGGVHGEDADTRASSGGDWNVRESLKYEWIVEDTSCTWQELTREGLCRAIGPQRNILIVGDSISGQTWEAMTNVLHGRRFQAEPDKKCSWHGMWNYTCPSLCSDLLGAGNGFSMTYVRNDVISGRKEVNGDPVHNVYESPWQHVVKEQDVKIVILNLGAHYQPDTDYANYLTSALAFLREKHSQVLTIFRNTPAGHPECWKYKTPLEQPLDVSGTPYHWDRFNGQNRIAQELVEVAGGIYMDVATMTALRPDGHYTDHLSNVSLGTDCLHYCQPGPEDAWIRLLYNTLLLLGSKL